MGSRSSGGICLGFFVGVLAVGVAPQLQAQCELPYDETTSTCAGGQVFDDGVLESTLAWPSSHTWVPTTYVQRFTPPSYPAVYQEVCIAWSRLVGGLDTDLAYEVVVYDDDGSAGDPGTLLATVPVTVTDVPLQTGTPRFVFSSVSLAVPAISSGSVYIGFHFDPSVELDFGTPLDKSVTTPQQVIRTRDGGSPTWWAFTSPRAMFIRARSTSDYVVVPQSLEFSAGNTFSGLPFRPNPRYQQVYLGSEVGAREISEIRFRASVSEEDERLCPDLLTGLTISLSTTQKAVDGLSSTFSENPGPDAVVVFEGDYWISARGSGNRSPLPFDIAIPLQRPFFFGGAGNLLLDINTHEDSLFEVFRFDTHNASDGISRAFCGDMPGCTDGDTAFPPDTQGAVTMFLKGAHMIFTDGFESGSVTRWSNSTP